MEHVGGTPAAREDALLAPRDIDIRVAVRDGAGTRRTHRSSEKGRARQTGELLGSVLLVEETRAERYRKALECVYADEGLKADWRMRMQRAKTRAAALARTLSALGVGVPERPSERSDRLIAAMDMALRDGDKAAAEAVARACVALAEMHATREWERVGAATIGDTHAAIAARWSRSFLAGRKRGAWRRHAGAFASEGSAEP